MCILQSNCLFTDYFSERTVKLQKKLKIVVSCQWGSEMENFTLKKVDMRQIAGTVKDKEADVGSVSLYY